MDFDSFDALTFDCYGTLIDWERGILDATWDLLGPGHPSAPEDRLELFARLEAAAESGAYRPYRSVLADVAVGMGRALGVDVTPREAADFAGSVGSWPPFPDTVPALEALASRYRLAIVSNVDDDLFADTAPALGVRFEHVVTAEAVGSYKPSHAHFHEAMRRLDLPSKRILHVAQSLYHDIRPATELGLAHVWINRRAGAPGAGATRPAAVVPDLEVPDLASLVIRAGLG